MKAERKNLLVRVATAVVGLPVIGVFVFWQDSRGFTALCLLAALLSLVEYTGLTERAPRGCGSYPILRSCSRVRPNLRSRPR